jgi:hypothetical protein
VVEKGSARKWIKIKQTWDIHAAYGIYKKIALHSLAHWLGGECEQCNGTKISVKLGSRVHALRRNPGPRADQGRSAGGWLYPGHDQ